MQKNSGKNKKAGDRLIWFLLIIFAAVFAFSIYMICSGNREYGIGAETYEGLAQTMVTRAEPKHTETAAAQTQVKTEVPKEQSADNAQYQPLLAVDFEALYEINKDTVAWLSADNGQIDYPVVQGSDNVYYLNHLFDGTENKNGAIFVDSRNTPGFQDRNTFIYGHNMNNDTMFASLILYGTEGYYEQNSELVLVTPEESYYLQPFSGYVTGPNSDTYKLKFAGDTSFAEYLEQVRSLSDFEAGVSVTAQDRIVTLSTCSYAYNEARYVLHCKLVLANE